MDILGIAGWQNSKRGIQGVDMYLGNQYYIQKFEKHVCSACGLCKPTFPAFCMTTYGGNPDRFFTIIKHIKTLQLTNREVLALTYSFEGFCGLFCNSKPKCPNRNSNCEKLGYVFSCYEAFVDQCGISVPDKTKDKIWATFSDTKTSKIGLRFKLPTTNPLKALDKKKKKRVNKLIKRAKLGMKADIVSYGSKTKIRYKRKRPIKTTFFCNDEEEWKKQIDVYLENNEADNRQPVANA